ncbi:MAG: PilN domain-containing protein [Candidatus Eisenbacteria bacterium]
MTSINLIPHDVLEARRARTRLRYWTARIAFTLAAVAALYGTLARIAIGSHGEFARVNGRYEALKRDLRAAETLILQRDDLLSRHAAIQAIHGSEPTSELLRRLSAVLTPTSHLTYLSIERCPPLPAAASGGCSGTLRLRGYAAGHRDVGEILRGLRDAGIFTEVHLIGITEPAGPEATGEATFEVVCALQSESGGA